MTHCIENFLTFNLKITLHEAKGRIGEVSHGIGIVGTVVEKDVLGYERVEYVLRNKNSIEDLPLERDLKIKRIINII
jgi:hypothetical protein